MFYGDSMLRLLLSSWALLVFAGCSPAPVTPGETVVVVDTDLPVPDIVEALRLDVYAEDGTWLSARDVKVADPAQWPVSFGITAPEGRASRVLVRARAYPSARLRDYAGAGSAPAVAPFRDPVPAATLPELCARLPDLPIGGTVTLRYAATKVTTPLDDGGCNSAAGPYVARSGTAGARVHIETPGAYRFEVLQSAPFETLYALFLRRDCLDATSEVACARGRRDAAQDAISVLEPARLDAGPYTLFAISAVPDQPAEIVVGASFLAPGTDGGAGDGGGIGDGGRGEGGSVVKALAPAWPRLVRNGRDETPPSEPREEVTTEAFAFVDIASDELRHARLVLGGDCIAKAATTRAASEGQLDVASVLACEAGRQVAPHVLPTEPGAPSRDPSTILGLYARGKPCAATGAGRVCAEGGMMVLGSELFGGTGVAASTPERVVRIPTLYADRDELSVADYRAALASGYAPPPGFYILATEGPLDVRALDRNKLCTFSTAPMGREDMPLNCITWPVARALCQHRGGDLPTEAVWEYLARKAGRSRTTLYPWGNEDPTCDDAIYDRVLQGPQTGACAPRPSLEGPQPRSVGSRDVTPLGIRNLAGSIEEWCLDAFASYAEGCWPSASVDSPRCDLGVAPSRSVRGGSFVTLGTVLAAPVRGQAPAMNLSAARGLRCVYESP